METKKTSLENIEKRNPFTVPEGYFENLTNQILTSLPEKETEKKSIQHTIWKRVSPWVYLAAMITGIAFGIGLFVKQEQPKTPAVAQEETSQSTNMISTEDVLLSFVSDYELYEYLSETE